MYTLGINAAYHDSAACLVHDGQVVAAAEEERFTRVKHAKRPVPFTAYELPYHAIDFCLRRAGIGLADVNHVAYSYDPWRFAEVEQDGFIVLPLQPSTMPAPPGFESPWDPLFMSYVVNAPRQLRDGVPLSLASRFRLPAREDPYQWHFLDHHLAHEASAYLPSPFDEAAVLVLDGRGERATTSYSRGEGHRIERIAQVNVPHSLGLLYEQVTRYLGFLHSSDEYKVMALAAFGRPRFLSEFRKIVEVGEHGQYTVSAPELEQRFGPARAPGAALQPYHHDVASSLQAILEETVMELADWLQAQTGTNRLCLAGGVALNCVMNARLQRSGPFREVWVQPAAGDAGTALGAALWVDAQQRGARDYVMEHAYLGPAYDDAEIERLLRSCGAAYRRWSDMREIAALLAADKIIGWYQGAMEYGPRALGARSFIASPIKAEMQQRLNLLKDREDFRPVAPAVLEEDAARWFFDCRQSPFMLFTYKIRPDKLKYVQGVAHVDQSARVQTVSRRHSPLFHELISAFKAATDVPMVVNTSFNTAGRPIVCTPRDALECFWTSPVDALVIGSFLLKKPRGLA